MKVDDEFAGWKIDFEELRADRERNKKSRLAFVKWYADWLLKTPNKVWSKAQKDIVEQFE